MMEESVRRVKNFQTRKFGIYTKPIFDISNIIGSLCHYRLFSNRHINATNAFIDRI